MYSLNFRTGPFKGQQLVVEQANLLIGRDPQCDLRITYDPEISRRHATIEDRGGKIFIRDVGSLNEILVNGEPTQERELKHKDRIQLGDSSWVFRRVDPNEEPAAALARIRPLVFACVAAVLMVEIMLFAGVASWRERFLQSSYNPFAGLLDKAPAPAAVEAPSPATGGSDEAAEPGQHVGVGDRALSPLSAGSPLPKEAAVETLTEEEIAAVKAAVEQLQSRMDELETSRATATVVSTDNGPAGQEGDAVLERAETMLEEALLEMQKHNLKQADEHLRRIQLLAPDFVPAYVERARLMERRGMLREAEVEWAEVLKRTVGTPLYVEAVAERTRLARAVAMQKTVERKKESTRGSAHRLPRRFRIRSVEHQKFLQNEEYDEMRLVRVAVKPKSSERNIDAEEVRVAVVFFDRDSWHGNITPSRATVPEDALSIEGHWEPREERTVTAAYIIPAGFREHEQTQYGDQRRYYGYVVRVYYRGELQDQSASPKSLLIDDAVIVDEAFDALLASARSAASL